MALSHDPEATARVYRRIDRIIRIDQEVLALRTERQRLVDENEGDEWLAEGKRWRGSMVSLKQYRLNMRFRPRYQPMTKRAA